LGSEVASHFRDHSNTATAIGLPLRQSSISLPLSSDRRLWRSLLLRWFVNPHGGFLKTLPPARDGGDFQKTSLLLLVATCYYRHSSELVIHQG
jgi:hypothetical protein